MLVLIRLIRVPALLAVEAEACVPHMMHTYRSCALVPCFELLNALTKSSNAASSWHFYSMYNNIGMYGQMKQLPSCAAPGACVYVHPLKGPPFLVAPILSALSSSNSQSL